MSYFKFGQLMWAAGQGWMKEKFYILSMMMIKHALWISTQRHSCKTLSHAACVHRVEGNQNVRESGFIQISRIFFVHLRNKDITFLRTNCTVCVSLPTNCCLLKRFSNLFKNYSCFSQKLGSSEPRFGHLIQLFKGKTHLVMSEWSKSSCWTAEQWWYEN